MKCATCGLDARNCACMANAGTVGQPHRWKESVYCGLPGDGEILLTCRDCGASEYVPWKT